MSAAKKGLRGSLGPAAKEDPPAEDPAVVAAREILDGRLERRFEKIRQSFVDEYGFMPAWIGPDGVPHRKGDSDVS